MGIRKDGKKLVKLGQKAAKRLGTEGKRRVAEFFANAIEILERELDKQRGASSAKRASVKKTARPRRRAVTRRVEPARAPRRRRRAAVRRVRVTGSSTPAALAPPPAVQAVAPIETE